MTAVWTVHYTYWQARGRTGLMAVCSTREAAERMVQQIIKWAPGYEEDGFDILVQEIDRCALTATKVIEVGKAVGDVVQDPDR